MTGVTAAWRGNRQGEVENNEVRSSDDQRCRLRFFSSGRCRLTITPSRPDLCSRPTRDATEKQGRTTPTTLSRISPEGGHPMDVSDGRHRRCRYYALPAVVGRLSQRDSPRGTQLELDRP